MNIIRQKLNLSMEEQDIVRIWDAISSCFQPLIHEVKFDFLKKIGIEEKEEESKISGELFFSETGQLLYFLTNEQGEELEIGTLIENGEGSEVYNGYKELIINNLDQAKTLNWEALETQNQQFANIKEVSLEFEVPLEEKKASIALNDEKLRSILHKIQETGACFFEDITQGPEDYETPQLINQLEKLGLIEREFYIFCKKSGQQISKVNSLKALEEVKSHGFKCFSCGTLISKERVSPHIKCSELGEKFSKPNYWLGVYLVTMLEDMNLAINDLRYKSEKNGRIFDVFSASLDNFLMFEVWDSPMRMQDIFLFLARVKFYKPFRAILVTSHPVPIGVRLYLKNFNEYPISLVEGLVNLEEVIKESYAQNKDIYLRNLLARFQPQTSMEIDDLIVKKYFKPTEELEENLPTIEVVLGEKTEQEETLENISDFIEVIPGEEVSEPPVEEIPEIDTAIAPQETMEIEELNQLIEETEEPTVKTEPGVPVEELPAVEEAPVEEATQEEQEMVESTLEQPREALMTSSQVLEEELEEETAEADKEGRELVEEVLEEKPEFGFEFNEALPDEVLPSEEFPLAETSAEEDLEKSADLLLSHYNESEVGENLNLIEQELEEINNIGLFTSALVTADGLMLVNNLNSQLDGDQLAAYGSVIVESIDRSLKESDFGSLESIHLEGRQGRLKLFPGEDLVVVVHEDKSATEMEIEQENLPGETSLREAVLSKVIQDLADTEGVKCSLLLEKDGLIVESRSNEEGLDPESLGFFSSMVLANNRPYFKELFLGEVTQLFIKTSNNYYYLIPIEEENILALCLNASIPREFWHNKIPQGAQMLKSVLA